MDAPSVSVDDPSPAPGLDAREPGMISLRLVLVVIYFGIFKSLGIVDYNSLANYYDVDDDRVL
jgi:hypothetical protein